jgi:hypothetical protein
VGSEKEGKRRGAQREGEPETEKIPYLVICLEAFRNIQMTNETNVRGEGGLGWGGRRRAGDERNEISLLGNMPRGF